MRFSTKLKPCYNLIDLTPLVDVIFLMLIFFMVTSDTLPLKSLLIQQPKLPAQDISKLAQLIVIMDKDQVIYIGSKKEIVDLSSLGESLKKHIIFWQEVHQGATPTVMLSIDRRIEYDIFLRLFHEVAKTSPKIRLAYKAEEGIAPDKEAADL
jgi:biopolymer transport protein ExbD